MNRIIAVLCALAVATPAAAAVSLQQAVSVAVEATQSAKIVPAGVAYRLCTGEDLIQQEFRARPSLIPLARELAALKGPIYDALAPARHDFERLPGLTGMGAASVRQAHRDYMTLRSDLLAPLALELALAIQRAGDTPDAALLDMAAKTTATLPPGCTREPCCDVTCAGPGCCTITRCDNVGPGPGRVVSCKSTIPGDLMADCQPPPVACSTDEPAPGFERAGGTTD